MENEPKSSTSRKPRQNQPAAVPTPTGDAHPAEPVEAEAERPATEAAPAQPKPADETDGLCPVVGIGASAGGLAAFERFCQAMAPEAERDLALVLVQHLDPDRKSLLTDLIRQYTHMRVAEVKDGMEVRPGWAYIIPPNKDMALLDGKLQLREPSNPRGLRLPIDFFFRSLAQDRREKAIGVVLSGTGTDGTLGLKAIKESGGLIMVQAPDSAQYDGMPRSAIGTGLADYVLPPEEMPGRLFAYIQRAFARPRSSRNWSGTRAGTSPCSGSSCCCARRPGMISRATSRTPSSGASSGAWPSTRSKRWKAMCATCTRTRLRWPSSSANC